MEPNSQSFSETTKTVTGIGVILTLVGFMSVAGGDPQPGWPLLVVGVILLATALFGGFEHRERGK